MSCSKFFDDPAAINSTQSIWLERFRLPSNNFGQRRQLDFHLMITPRIGRIFLFVLAVVSLMTAASRVLSAPKQSDTQTSAPKKRTTSASAKKKAPSKKRKPVVRTQLAPTPDRIKEIQSALAKQGTYTGEPTGRWDAATEDAMKKYQTNNGFSPTGKIDAVSLNKLGLGSETAGKGAPVPTASATTPDPAPGSKP
jgi:hypothetical protein